MPARLKIWSKPSINVRQIHGRIDALVLNAGISEPAQITEVTPEHFDRHFDVNVRGTVFRLQAALSAMGKGGSAVLVGSIADNAGIPSYGTYAATKAALRSYARTWTAELATKGIRVNVVAPGPTDTEMMAAVPEDVRKALIAPIPMGRMADPTEVAALFLLSDKASYIAGVELCVDGGCGKSEPRDDAIGSRVRVHATPAHIVDCYNRSKSAKSKRRVVIGTVRGGGLKLRVKASV